MINIKKIKSRIDFYKYLLFLDKSRCVALIVNIIIFLISLRLILDDIINFEKVKGTDITNIMLFGFSLFNIGWALFSQYKEIESFTGANSVKQSFPS